MTRKSTRKTQSRRRPSSSKTTRSRRKTSTRSRKTSTRSEKPQPLSEQLVLLLTRLRNSFGPRQKEVLAILLLVSAVLTFLGLVNVTTGSLIDAWIHWLRQAFGLGAYPLALAFAILAVWLLLQTVGLVSPLRWKSAVGLQIAFVAGLALVHHVASGDDALALAQSGQGGGYVGWAIADWLQSTWGDLIALLSLLIGLAVGLALSFDWTLDDLTSSLLYLADRLRGVAPEPSPSVEPKIASTPAPSREKRSPR